MPYAVTDMSLAKTSTGPLFALVMVLSALAAAPRAHADLHRAVATKPVIAGFIDMQDIAWHNTDDGQPKFMLHNIEKFPPGMFGGIVFNGTWNEMQPDEGGPLVSDRLDKALRKVRKYNLAHPDAPLGVKLRVYSGNQAPPWAKALDGGPITILRNEQGCHTGNCEITIGKVWDPVYIAAWRAFQALLAARYDSVPVIRSVAITSCAMETDEPFVMPVDQPVPDGYTDKAGRECLRGAVDDYSAWKRTVIDYTINPFVKIQRGGPADVTFSIKVMNECRRQLGARCELGNHALSNDMTPDNLVVVAAIGDRGAPIHYQTEGPAKMGFKWKPTIRRARRYHATAVELWPEADLGGFTSLSTKELQRLLDVFDSDIVSAKHRP